MLLSLGDITHLNPRMADINDVQLAWFPRHPNNAKLTEFYIWSSHAIGTAKPSVELLEKVRDAFLWGSSPNRFVFRATYGHGKTHLALALANYFGRASETVEVQNILTQLRACAPNKAESFATFKEDRAPFLVVRLFGENVRNLPQAVVSAIETALHEQEATQNHKLGFWFDKALQGFEKLSEDQVEKANAFLAEKSTDLPTICQGLRNRDGELYELSCQVIEHITGFAPDFGRAVELNSLITEVCDEFCGEGKPFSGLLFLFDEFSAFVRSYARDFAITRGAPLQSLLDGIANRSGRAVFVALSQYDPDSDVQTTFRQIGAGEDDRQGVIKELTRLPQPQRHLLYSSLELVLSKFLLQDDDQWQQLTQDDEVWEQVTDASNEVMRLFAEHYSEDMGWGDELVQTVIAQGCFPFHPLTIAILCKSNLRGDESGARTVMQYITEALDDKKHQPAICDGVLNWISPISLVEKFGHAIADSELLWRQYDQAKRNAGSEAPDAQKQALHAMLLHEVVGLKVSRAQGDYERNIAVLAGLSRKEAETALSDLQAGGYINRDETRNVYTFWSVGEDGSKVKKPLTEETNAVLGNVAKLEAALERAISKWGWKDEEVTSAPGHPQDWAAEMVLVPRALFTVARVKKLVQTYGFKPGSLLLNEAPRGVVVSLVASSPEDRIWYRENAQNVLDQALADFGDAPPPLILRLPQFPQGNFVKALVQEQVLDSWDAEKRRDVGLKPYNDIIESVKKDILTNHNAYLTDVYVVPMPYSSVVNSQTIGNQVPLLDKVLRLCYEQAYRYAPSFFTQERASTNAQLKSATHLACTFAIKGTFADWDSYTGINPKAHGKARDLYNRFLQGNVGQGGWGVVDTTGRLQEPTSGKVKKGWEVLDAAVPPGSERVPVKDALLKLLNAPYGYDYNTLSLLFCTWIGFHLNQLEVTNKTGWAVSLKETLGTRADLKDFLEKILATRDIHLTRRDAAENKKQVEILTQRIRFKEHFTLDEAKAALYQLETFSEDESNEPRLIESSKNAKLELQNDLKLAEEYAQKLSALERKVSEANTIKVALDALDEAQKEIPLGSVRPVETRSTAELTQQTRAKLKQINDNFCAKMESLSDIRDASKNQTNLDTAKSWFVQRGLSDLRDRVQDALYNLSQREDELRSEDKDKEFVTSLKSLKSEKRLAALREGRLQLDAYTSNSPKTEAAIADARSVVQDAIYEHLSWFSPLANSLDLLNSEGAFSRFNREIDRRLERFEGTPEGLELATMQKRIDGLEKVWSKLAELRREKPKNNDELKKLGKSFDKLAESEVLSDKQKSYIADAKTEIESRFVAAVESAKAQLDRYEIRNSEGEDPVALKNELIKALDREMAYLADEHKSRLRNLDRAIQRRIDDDEIKSVEANFLRIQDPVKRRECLRMLQKHVSVEVVA